MPLIEYPSELPPPAGYPFSARERRALPQGAGDEQPRARSRDAIIDADTVRWRYSPEEMAVWRQWYRDTLINGQLWFSVTLPGRGGWITRVARYISEQLQIAHLGAGNWEVSCRLELRGLSAPPQTVTPESCLFLLNHADETSGTTAESVAGPDLVVTGAAALSAGAAVWGTGGVGATGSGDYTFGTTAADLDPTGRHIEFEGWFNRSGTGDPDDNVTLLRISNLGGDRFMRIAVNGQGGAAVLQYEGVNGTTNASLAAMGFTIDEPSHVVLKFNHEDGYFSVYQDGTRIAYLALGTEPGYFDGIDFTVLEPLDFSTNEANTGVFQVDEVRLTVCTNPIYSGASIEVPTGPFPNP